MQATWIRNSLLRGLREAKVANLQSLQSLVYDNPSIARLSTSISTLVSGDDVDTASLSDKAQAMRAMAAKYSADFPAHQADSQRVIAHGGDVVLITGTTGALGSYLLALAESDPSIAIVYAVNRPARDGQPLGARQRLALLDRGIDAGILDSQKIRLIEADLTADNFGVAQEVYDQVKPVNLKIHLTFKLATFADAALGHAHHPYR